MEKDKGKRESSRKRPPLPLHTKPTKSQRTSEKCRPTPAHISALANTLLSNCLRFLTRWDGLAGLRYVCKRWERVCREIARKRVWPLLHILTLSEANEMVVLSPTTARIICKFKPDKPRRRKAVGTRKRREFMFPWPTCVAQHGINLYISQYNVCGVIHMVWSLKKQAFTYRRTLFSPKVLCPEGLAVSDNNVFYVASAVERRTCKFIDGKLAHHQDLSDLIPWNMTLRKFRGEESLFIACHEASHVDYRSPTHIHSGVIVKVNTTTGKGEMITQLNSGTNTPYNHALNRPSGIAISPKGDQLYVTTFVSGKNTTEDRSRRIVKVFRNTSNSLPWTLTNSSFSFSFPFPDSQNCPKDLQPWGLSITQPTGDPDVYQVHVSSFKGSIVATFDQDGKFISCLDGSELLVLMKRHPNVIVSV
ncbi:hypothetical protein AAMO2058_001217900 [Amorphochlora amoebiformis]